MSFASLRTHALMTAAGIATAVIVPLGATAAMAPAASAAPTTPVASATATHKTAAQLAAEKKAAAKKAAAKKAAAKKAAAKKAAAKRALAKKKAKVLARGKKVLKTAAKYKGRPYHYGGAGPRSFDCSGFTRYVMRKALHVSLPHNAAAQAHSKKTKKIKKKDRKIGDLIFFHRGGGISHVAIYAGHGLMWDAPHTGSHVKKHKIHSGRVTYERIKA